MTHSPVLLTPLPVPQPLLRWVGGKRRLLLVLTAATPHHFNRYFEPFIGAGSLYFGLHTPGKWCTIGDAQPALTDLYTVARDCPQDLISAVNRYSRQRNKAAFLKLRGIEPTDPVERAAWLLYISRCAFNGLFRPNSDGVCNSSWGNDSGNTPLIDKDILASVHQRLQGTRIISGSFEKSCERAKSGDFVYFDPPYLPLSRTSDFSTYTKGGFGKADHKRLAELICELTDRGVYVMLSNSDTPETRAIYSSLEMRTVAVHRSVGASARSRGTVKEILGVNYPATFMARLGEVKQRTRLVR